LCLLIKTAVYRIVDSLELEEIFVIPLAYVAEHEIWTARIAMAVSGGIKD